MPFDGTDWIRKDREDEPHRRPPPSWQVMTQVTAAVVLAAVVALAAIITLTSTVPEVPRTAGRFGAVAWTGP